MKFTVLNQKREIKLKSKKIKNRKALSLTNYTFMSKVAKRKMSYNKS